MKEVIKAIVMAQHFCKEGDCTLCVNALDAALNLAVDSHSRGGQHKVDQSLADSVPLTNLAVHPQAGTPADSTSQPEICPLHNKGKKCAWGHIGDTFTCGLEACNRADIRR